MIVNNECYVVDKSTHYQEQPKTDDEEIPQPEATAHAIAANIVGVEGRLISHIGEFTQSGKKRVKAYTNAYEFQVLNILSEYEHKETRGRKWVSPHALCIDCHSLN